MGSRRPAQNVLSVLAPGGTQEGPGPGSVLSQGANIAEGGDIAGGELNNEECQSGGALQVDLKDGSDSGGGTGARPSAGSW